MNATPDQLPNDIEKMKRLYLAQAAELAAAKAGLMIYALEIEKLKFQLARLRRQRFGSSSERIEREIAQLELKLEEIEAAKAEAEAKAEAAAPVTPNNDRYGHKQACAGKDQEAAPQVPRASAAHNGRPRATSVPHAGLRRRAAQGERGRHRDPQVYPRPLRGGAARTARHVVPQMREHGAGADAGAPDPAGRGGRQRASSRGNRKVLRSSPALSAVRNLRPRRCRPRPFTARRLDWKVGVVAGTAGPKDRRTRQRRRHSR